MSRRPGAHDPPPADDAAQRIDKWLWCARLVKTRALAQKLAEKGKIRLTRNGSVQRIEKAHSLVRRGDRLTFVAGGKLQVLEILSFADRRGPAAQAKTLYSAVGDPN